ncbi:MAG: undecaprenyl-diphosphate phosphatase [bacterium]
MNIFQAIILGIIEGLTEFLPISSTGHLIIAEKILGISSSSQFFITIIQLGAISASVYYFRKKIIEIFKDTLKLKNKKFSLKSASTNELLGLWILISIIPTLIIAYIFRKSVDQWQTSILLVACTTAIFGVVFYIIELWHKSKKENKVEIETVKLHQLLLMGLFQSIAIVPGVSRSGITIAGGLLQNIKIKDSIELSFLMGIPVIFAASIYKFLDIFKDFSFSILFMTIVGLITSFIVGFYSIKLTLGIVGKKGFFPFMIYRLLLASAILIFFFSGLL